jgi:hypothetical protein
MYSFAQRQDTTVVDEPLYAHFLTKTNTEAQHPGTAEILATQNHDGEQVVQNVILGAYDTPVVLFKQMTHHLIDLDRAFLLETENVLLIRNPRRILASYTKVIDNPSMHDIGIKMQYDLFQQLKNANKLAAVVDAKQLLLNPKKVLSALCEQLGISFTEKMLKWEAGARSEDGSWAKYWYANVHQSTGFQAYQEKPIQLDDKHKQLAEESTFYYEELFKYAIKS